MHLSKLLPIPFVQFRGSLQKNTTLTLCAALIGACSGGSQPTAQNLQEVTDIAPDTAAETPLSEEQPAPALVANPEQIDTRVACDATGGEIQTAMLLLVNEFRATSQSCGATVYPAVAALGWNSTLEQAASTHSVDMAVNNLFSHTGSDGSSLSIRVDTAGYNWSAVAENIAAGQQDAEAAVKAWTDSAGHCKNMMNSNFEEIAVSCRKQSGTDFTNYWTMVLGTQP